ncbi:hypothetical protein D3874_11035 [Oleomonas cavernae]|uniref:Periplasmic heavy metal sensor n=1 Tax=Oleomonas cavernae TaxID=2320859 RepID=A0A418WBY2_9PROT|nr:Spy/CpxP family protein refolding chaperone [Oleomonas cavernae]RJF87484.1 hypothetical protein D3874_11035 [Oleomonas cavernae]
MTTLRKLIAVGALLLTTTQAFAEDAHHPGGGTPATPPAASPAPGASPGMMGAGMMMSMMEPMMAPDRIEGRIAFLEAELKVTDAQRPLWNAFAEAIRANTRAMAGMMMEMQGAMMPAPGTASPTLLQRIESHERMLAARLDSLRQLKAALQPLYAALDDSQRQTADKLLMPAPMGPM